MIINGVHFKANLHEFKLLDEIDIFFLYQLKITLIAPNVSKLFETFIMGCLVRWDI